MIRILDQRRSVILKSKETIHNNTIRIRSKSRQIIWINPIIENLKKKKMRKKRDLSEMMKQTKKRNKSTKKIR